MKITTESFKDIFGNSIKLVITWKNRKFLSVSLGCDIPHTLIAILKSEEYDKMPLFTKTNSQIRSSTFYFDTPFLL